MMSFGSNCISFAKEVVKTFLYDIQLWIRKGNLLY